LFWDFRNRDVQEWVAEKVLVNATTSMYVDGLFVDDPAGYGQEHPAIQSVVQLSPAEVAALQLGTQQAWLKALGMLLPRKKYIMQAYSNVVFPSSSTPAVCASWMRQQCTVPANESTSIFVVGHDVNMSVAAFLVARGPFSLITMSKAVIEGRNYSDPEYRSYRLDTGTPTGGCVEAPTSVFSRNWTGGRAAVDCTMGMATLDFALLPRGESATSPDGVGPIKTDDDDHEATGVTATILAHTQVLRAAKYGCPGYPYPVPPPPPPGPCSSCIRMLACNASDEKQRWTHPSNGAISPKSSAQQCVTREQAGAPLSISICRGHAGSLDPAQQWIFNSSSQRITDIIAQGVEGGGCVDIGSNPKGGTESILHHQSPCKNSVNEHFLYDSVHGWIFSNCSGINCAHEHDDKSGLQATYCATAPVNVETDADSDSAENCVPWKIDKNESRDGYYFDGGPTSLALSSNDTVLSFHCGEKFKHLDDNNHGDIILRRSFNQGRTWQPWQLVFSPSVFYAPRVFAVQTGTVLDRVTGTIWAIMAANNSMLLVTSSSNHGATWSPAKDISVASKPSGYGWIAPISNGIQLQSGRLAICADHIKGQWSACKCCTTRLCFL
jgi:hypothetical protein